MTNKELKMFKPLKRRSARSGENEIMEECNKLQAFIEDIPDKVTKEIFRLHYEKGLTWQRVALEFGWISESTPRKIARQYLARENQKSKTR